MIRGYCLAKSYLLRIFKIFKFECDFLGSQNKMAKISEENIASKDWWRS